MAECLEPGSRPVSVPIKCRRLILGARTLRIAQAAPLLSNTSRLGFRRPSARAHTLADSLRAAARARLCTHRAHATGTPTGEDVSAPVWAEDVVSPNPMDISGRFNTSAPHLVQLDDSNGSNGRLHYANSSYYRHLW